MYVQGSLNGQLLRPVTESGRSFIDTGMYSVRLHEGLEHVPPSVVRCVNCPTRLVWGLSRNHPSRSEEIYTPLKSQLHLRSSFLSLPAMFTSIPFTLLIIIYIRYILPTKAEVPSCFYPNEGRAEGDYACNLTAEVSFCCAVGYSCLDNKICTGSGDDIQPYNRGSCTDQTWNSPACPQFCQDFSPDGGSWLVNCNRWADDKGVCCYDVYASEPLGCCTNSSAEVFMLDGSATAFHSISSGAATQNRIVPSSTITTTPTPSSTASSVSSPSPIPDASRPSKLSTAAYVGIAIGIAVGLALLWAAIYLLRKRRRSRQQDHRLMPFTASPRESPAFSHSMKQGNVYGDSVGAATPIELAAENRVSELETEILLELEGDREHK
jgi:hypothetical protein